jgi:hypothetical protein
MSDEIKIALICVMTVLLFTGICFYGGYKLRELKVQNFQNTIKDLSDEQKCLHICGFEFNDALEGYKFCIEKCDRISERTVK